MTAPHWMGEVDVLWDRAEEEHERQREELEADERQLLEASHVRAGYGDVSERSW